MAEQTNKEVCSICLSNFQQPVIIDCHHSFCFVCLEDFVSKTSRNNQFICPLCRCLIQIPTGGLNQLKPKPNIEDHSTINIQQCDVCTEITSQYFCRDCNQYLCKSCKTMHDKMTICKDHVAFRFNANQSREPRSYDLMKERRPPTVVRNHKKICPNHERQKVTIYCKDCSLAICCKCFLASHNGHNYLDFQEDEENIRQYLRTLNEELETQIERFEKQYGNLNSLLIEAKTLTKSECDKVDIRVGKICSEFHKIGENMKKEMQKTCEEEESKFGKLMKDNKMLTENLKATVRYPVNGLDDSSIDQVLQRLPKVRQEKDESSCRTLDIPDIRYSTFHAAEIDKTLSKQLGIIVSCYRNMIGKSCNEDMFEHIACINNITGSLNLFGDKHYVLPGSSWGMGTARGFESTLIAALYLTRIDSKSIGPSAPCKADVTFKVINKNDDRQSVVKQCIMENFSHMFGQPSCCCELIKLEYLNDTRYGFIDANGFFTIQVFHCVHFDCPADLNGVNPAASHRVPGSPSHPVAASVSQQPESSASGNLGNQGGQGNQMPRVQGIDMYQPNDFQQDTPEADRIDTV